MLKMEVKITRIKEQDQEKAYQFCQSIFSELKWDKRFAYGLENLKQSFGGSGEIFLVMKKENKIIGCAGLKRLSDKEALIKRFYIAKGFRRKGLGSLMIEKIKGFAKKQGYKVIFLDVHHKNERGQKFYEQHGFLVCEPSVYENWPESGHPELFEFRKLVLE